MARCWTKSVALFIHTTTDNFGYRFGNQSAVAKPKSIRLSQ
jgi:hypothetical protein